MKVKIQATDKQRKFLEAVLQNAYYEQIGFGGARGGGKTFISCLVMVIRRLLYPGTRGLMLRRVQKAADKNLGEEIKKVCVLLGLPLGPNGARWMESKKEWHFPNGSYIVLGYCKNENDWENYQGIEYADIAFEEAGQFPERAWLNISGSNRSNNPKCTPKRWATFNPGGIGSSWVDKRFGIKDNKTADNRTLFIQSLLKESKALLEADPGYRDRVLSKLPEWRRKQWEDGDWDAIEGAFFQINPAMFRKQEVPYWAEINAGVDAGYWPAAFGVVYVAKWVDADGKLRVHVMSEIKKHRLNLKEQAEEGTELEKVLLKTHSVNSRYADPAAWKRTEGDGGISSSTAWEWAKYGFVVTAAVSNARAAGWLLLRTLLDLKILTIDPSCHALRYEMENAVHDTKSDDIKQGPDVEDHLLDALRYVVMSTVAMPSPEEEKPDYNNRRAKLVRRKKTTVLD